AGRAACTGSRAGILARCSRSSRGSRRAGSRRGGRQRSQGADGRPRAGSWSPPGPPSSSQSPSSSTGGKGAASDAAPGYGVLGRISWTDVDASDGRCSPAEAKLVGRQRSWIQGWRRYVGLSVLLAYLWYVGSAVTENSSGAGAVFGLAVLVVFAVCWLVTVVQAADVIRAGPMISRRYWIPYPLPLPLFAAELPFAHAAAFVLCIYLTIATVIFLGARAAP